MHSLRMWGLRSAGGINSRRFRNPDDSTPRFVSSFTERWPELSSGLFAIEKRDHGVVLSLKSEA